MLNHISIRKCIEADIEQIAVLQPAGWSDITFYFRFYSSRDFCYPLVAAYNKQIIGVAAGIVSNDSGWLAHIIVSENYRKMGIGQRLTQTIIDYLYNQGCKTQILIATEMGEGLYRKCGFKTVGYYSVFQGKPFNIEHADANIKKIETADLDSVWRLDKKISGEQRRKMLSNFTDNGLVYAAGSAIQGFYLPQFGEGTILAENEPAGIALLNFKLSTPGNVCVIPEANSAASEFLKAHGCSCVRKIPRMVLGNNIKWQPQCIYSRGGGFYG